MSLFAQPAWALILEGLFIPAILWWFVNFVGKPVTAFGSLLKEIETALQTHRDVFKRNAVSQGDPGEKASEDFWRLSSELEPAMNAIKCFRLMRFLFRWPSRENIQKAKTKLVRLYNHRQCSNFASTPHGNAAEYMLLAHDAKDIKQLLTIPLDGSEPDEADKRRWLRSLGQ